MSRRIRPVGALVVVVVVTLGLGVAVTPAWAADYPTWADVEAAKHNEAAKKAEIAKIEALVNGLDTEAAEFAKAALIAAEQYNQAEEALNAAKADAETLQKSADAAQDRADTSSAQAGSLIAQLARTGSTDLTFQLLLAGADDADDLLYRLGAMNKLSEQSAVVFEQATLDANQAKALAERAAAARQAREKLAAKAQDALTAATTAAAEAEERAKNQKAVAGELYAQLASLKGTSAATEEAYLQGLAWEAAQEAIKNPPPPPPPVNPTPPAPNSGAVAGAIAFAQAQVGDPYVTNGMGPDGWDCAGLTKASYASVGVNIGPHGSTSQYNTMAAAGRLVPYNEIVAGDLLFYSTGGSTTATKYHVTLYIGNGLMIEAPYPGTNVRVKPIRYGDLVPYAGRPTP